MLGWLLYAIAAAACFAGAWKRIGEWDRANEELERRRNRHP
jgi:hypothetical protein